MGCSNDSHSYPTWAEKALGGKSSMPITMTDKTSNEMSWMKKPFQQSNFACPKRFCERS